MVKFNDEILEILGSLAEVCSFSENGFKIAAQRVQDIDLKRLFKQYAHQRSVFYKELWALIDKLGGNKQKDTSLAAASKQEWMKVVFSLNSTSDTATIAECERGEDQALDAYTKALEKDLPVKIRSLIEQQAAEILRIHNRIRALEKSNLF